MTKRKRKPRRKPQAKYDLDVIIPVFGKPDLLQRCLKSFNDTIGDIKARVIIVDDQGPDQGPLGDIYKTLNGTHRIVRNPHNLGFPKTVNAGVKAGNSSLVLLLNTDIELFPGAIEAMMTEFADPKVGIVGPKLIFPPGSPDPIRPAGKVQHAGMAVNFQGALIHANIGWSPDHPKVNERRSMQAVTGACLMTRRSVWSAVTKIYRDSGDKATGALNDVYSPGTFEDVEFCFAARSLDYEVIYTPLAQAYHLVGGSSALEKRGFPLERNAMIFRARCGQLLVWDEWRWM